jgi:CheY-like chemotaxis protein
VVEDVPAVRMLLAKLLRESGFQVVEASNGEEAIRLVEAGRPVQLVLSDAHMPGARIDGLDLARWLHEHRPDFKVILAPRVVSKPKPPTHVSMMARSCKSRSTRRNSCTGCGRRSSIKQQARQQTFPHLRGAIDDGRR